MSRITGLGRIEEWTEETYGERNMVWAVPFQHAYPRNGIRLPVHAILNALPERQGTTAAILVLLDGGLRADFRYGRRSYRWIGHW